MKLNVNGKIFSGSFEGVNYDHYDQGTLENEWVKPKSIFAIKHNFVQTTLYELKVITWYDQKI